MVRSCLWESFYNCISVLFSLFTGSLVISCLISVISFVSWFCSLESDIVPCDSANSTCSRAAFGLETASYSHWLMCLIVASCTLVGGPVQEWWARQFRLSDFCGPPHLRQIAGAFYLVIRCTISADFAQTSVRGQSMVGWKPRHRLPCWIVWRDLFIRAIPDLWNIRNPGRGAWERGKLASHGWWRNPDLFFPCGLSIVDMACVTFMISFSTISLVTREKLNSDYIAASTLAMW